MNSPLSEPVMPGGVISFWGSAPEGLGFLAVILVSGIISFVLLLKSILDFSQTGPELRREILAHFRAYAILAIARLALWAFALCALMAGTGVLFYAGAALLANAQLQFWPLFIAGVLGVLVLTTLQFCRHLLFLPGSIAASYHYRKSRLYPLWRHLTPKRLLAVEWLLGVAATALFAGSAWKLISLGRTMPGVAFALIALAAPFGALVLSRKRVPPAAPGAAPKLPNILMIGSDTLRADRLGLADYRRNLTPFIDSLAAKGSQFTACYVPCARTAPSLVSMLTGMWPHHHGIRDNFIGDEETRLAYPALASILSQHGYCTAAVSDWSGGDLGKFPLGFEILDLPKDQWNIKYLLRQGPKDLRLFLSLFTHNRFGKYCLPELYYLAGVPLTSLVGRDSRSWISQFAAQNKPFFLNVFISTTHPPFGSEYPYYTLYKNPDYTGESEFVMARLTDPWEIIRRQGDSRKEFDLEQIIDLYDGCVRNFDDEVRRIVEHVHACKIEDNTIIVIYSDHGMEFFEHETWGQGNSVRSDFSHRVPLVIVDPRLDKSMVCPHIVRSIDVTPTLLDLVGIPQPCEMDGVSLVSYLKGTSADLQLAAYTETGIWITDLPGMPPGHLRYPSLLDLLEVANKLTGTLSIRPEYRRIINRAKDRMIRVGPWKLTYQPTTDGGLYELYNVAEDPECRRNVVAQHVEIASELRSRLLDWIRSENGNEALTPTVPSVAYGQAQAS